MATITNPFSSDFIFFGRTFYTLLGLFLFFCAGVKN